MRTGWVEPDDGLLALDVNGNGAIDDITELFGSADTDGFKMLAVHDLNGDKVIDASDAVFGDLLVWTDLNSDGISQANELHSLADYNIASISLKSTRLAKVEIAGNDITHAGTYTLADGTERAIVDAWFRHDTVMTRNVEDYTFDIRTAFLPTLRGYGALKDLHIAASLDNDETDPDSVMARLMDLSSTLTLADALSDWASVKADVEGLLFRWAGIEAVDPSGRGENVDGQHIAYYEKFIGMPVTQYGSPNPLPEVGAFVEAAYDVLLTFQTIQLLTQADGTAIFDAPSYDLYRGETGGDLALLQSGIDAVAAVAAGAADPGAVWAQFAQLLGYTKGLSNLTAGDVAALDAAVQAGGVQGISDWQDVTNLMTATLGSIYESADDWGSFEVYYDNYTGGTNGDDVMVDDRAGGNISNELVGYDGNDTIRGLDGHDKLVGGDGDDILEGGTGDDFLIGGSGDEVYLYESGNDTIVEEVSGGYDELHIMASTGLTKAAFEANGDLFRMGDDLMIFLPSGETVTIDGYGAGREIEKIKFLYDNSEIDLAALITQKFNGTDGFDRMELIGTGAQTLLAYGYDGNDTIEAFGAAAKFYGGDGYDALIGDFQSDHLYGENGDDILLGAGGDDTLYGGYGNDTLQGGVGMDVLYGEAGNDTLSGDDGNDQIYGGSGNDTFLAGFGADRMEGSTGNDTYHWEAGADNDTIYEFSDSRGDCIVFEGLSSADVALERTGTSYGNPTYRNLQITNVSTAETLTVIDQFTSGDYEEIENFVFADTAWTQRELELQYILQHTTSGDDFVRGFAADDIFLASAGNDQIQGREGHDIYHWGVGAGNDIVLEYWGDDTLVLDSLNAADINLERTGTSYGNPTYRNLQITNLATSETFTVVDQFHDEAYEIDNFVFADGAIWTDQELELQYILKNTTSGDDYVQGFGAGEIFPGSAGNDLLYGNGGDDTFLSGAGNDALHGSEGSDVYCWASGAGNDTIYEWTGANDTLVFEGINLADVDILRAGQYDSYDLIFRNKNTNEEIRIFEQYGYDEERQIESFEFDDVALTMKQLEVEYIARNTIDNNSEVTKGFPGDDIFGRSTGDDELQGDRGNDQYFWGAGDGNDTVRDYTGENDTVTFVDLNLSDLSVARSGNDIIFTNLSSPETLKIYRHYESSIREIENFVFPDGITLTKAGIYNFIYGGLNRVGTENPDVLHGNHSDNTISGLEGNDVIYGWNGNDTISAGDGDDSLYGNAGANILTGGLGADTFVFEAATAFDAADWIQDFSLADGDVIDLSDILSGSFNPLTDNIANFVQIAGAVSDSLLSVDQSGTGNFTVIANLAGITGLTDEAALIASGNLIVDNLNLVQGTAADDTALTGTVADDRIYGFDGADTISGLDGNDFIDGGAGDDSLTGGAGDDYLKGGIGDDTLDGGDGVDVVDFSNAASGMEVNLSSGFAIGEGSDSLANIENVTGSDYSDELTGSAGDNEIRGGAGIDTIWGGAGNDALHTGDGSGVYWEPNNFFNWRVDDSLFGETGDDNLQAGYVDLAAIPAGYYADSFYLNGGNGDDVLRAGNVPAIIEGGKGNDVAYGSASGGDKYVYTYGDGVFSITQGGVDNYDWIILNTEGRSYTLQAQAHEPALDAHTVRIKFDNDNYIDVLDAIKPDGTSRIPGLLPGGAGELYDYINGDFLVSYIDFTTPPGSVFSAANDVINHAGNVSTLGGHDVIHGDENGTTLDAGAGNDLIYGHGGDDTLVGGAGDDILDGGDGRDTVDYSDATSGIVASLHAGTASNDGQGGVDVYSSIENIAGSAFADTITGSNGANILDGGDGNDTVYAREGNDTLYGGSGNDFLHSGDGNNLLYGGGGNDDLRGGSGIDTYYGGDGDDFLLGGSGDSLCGDAGNDNMRGYGGTGHFDGGEGVDVILWRDSSVAVTVDLVLGTATDSNNVTATIINVENITGSAFTDSLYGDSSANRISGGQAGVDLNTDYIYGRGGDDWLYGYDGDDFIYGGDGIDRAYGGNGIDQIWGDAGNDILNGQIGNDDLHGGDGDDTLYGEDGDDTFFGNADFDKVYGGSGSDVAYGGTGSDRLEGGLGNDVLYGEDGDDKSVNHPVGGVFYGGLFGQEGDDILFGGAGQDYLYGGSGADIFGFLQTDGSGTFDYINDFTLADGERIDISDLLTAYDPLTETLTDFVEITDDGTNSTLAIDVDGGADNFVVYATLTGVTGLTDEAALETAGTLVVA
ncbi:MAG: type I secretion C-terminal target domain-containing protein [Alphaproteobacteria bacterium]|nr:type I secretion C-terminal target domain-containing protein [Alphaproteobacteria bacterium]